MSLLERINADLKTAMLGGDAVATSTLRLLKSEIQNASIAAGTELDEKGVQQVIRKEQKKRLEGAEGFKVSGSPERAAAEEAEAKLLEAYLPAQVDPALVETFVKELIAQNKEINKGDAIRQTLAHFDGQTDGRVVSEIVGRSL